MTVNSGNLVFVIHRTHDTLRSCEDQIYGEQGLTAERYEVLTAIKYLDKPVRVTDLARRLMRSVNSISMIIDRMVKADLVKRVRDKRDRRSVHLSITSKGETLLEPATLVGQEFTQKILSQLSYEDRQALLGLLLTVQHEASDNEQAPEQPLLKTGPMRSPLRS